MNQNPIPEPPQFANYPRASFGPASRPPGIYFETISEAWQIFTQDTGTWVLSVLVAGLLSVPLLALNVYVSNGGSFMPQTATTTAPGYMLKIFNPLHFAVSLIAGAVQTTLYAGTVRMGALAARGVTIGVGDMFYGFRRVGFVFGTAFLLSLLNTFAWSVCVWVGTYMMIAGGSNLLPGGAMVLVGLAAGILIAGSLTFAVVISVDQPVNPFEAIKRSFTALKPFIFLMAVFQFVLGIVMMLGGCACGIGIFASFPVATIALGMHYNYFFPTETVNAPIYIPADAV